MHTIPCLRIHTELAIEFLLQCPASVYSRLLMLESIILVSALKDFCTHYFMLDSDSKQKSFLSYQIIHHKCVSYLLVHTEQEKHDSIIIFSERESNHCACHRL